MQKVAVFGVLGLLAASTVVGSSISATPAQAIDLPTWDDVQKAKNNQAAAAQKIKEIEALIADGQKELERLRNLHASAVTEMESAQEEYQAAVQTAETLKDQAAESRKEAEAAAEQASAIVAQMYRSGGVDRSMELFLESDEETADALLERLASMSKATERNTQISDDAEQAANTAESLTKQAESAEKKRDELIKRRKMPKKRQRPRWRAKPILCESKRCSSVTWKSSSKP